MTHQHGSACFLGARLRAAPVRQAACKHTSPLTATKLLPLHALLLLLLLMPLHALCSNQPTASIKGSEPIGIKAVFAQASDPNNVAVIGTGSYIWWGRGCMVASRC